MDDRLEPTTDRRRLATRSARPLVLIVEEHQDTRALYALALSAMGFDVIAAKDGTEGYLRAQEHHPDIIVTDLPMPNGDGQFLQDLKASSRTRDVPVVVVTGHMKTMVCEHAERDGFAAFLPKPAPRRNLLRGCATCSTETAMHRQMSKGRSAPVRTVARTPWHSATAGRFLPTRQR